MTTKTLTMIAGAAMAASAAIGPASTAMAAPSVQIQLGVLCFHIGPKAPKHVAKFKAGLKGYTNIGNMFYVPRRFGPHCGVYYSVGKKFGVKYAILSSIKTGKLIYAKKIGFGNPIIPGWKIKQKAALMGYKNLHALKYNNFTQRWTIEGYKKVLFQWKQYRLHFTKTGFYMGKQLLSSGPAIVPGWKIKQKAALMGYKNLHMLKYNAFLGRWTVRGWKKVGFVWKKYALRFTKTGAYLGRTLLNNGPAIVPGWKIKQKAALMGYKNLHMLKYNAFLGRYTIRGFKKVGFVWKKYVLRFTKTGAYLGRTQIGGGPAIVPGWKIKQKAALMGYKFLHQLKYNLLTQRWTIKGSKKLGFFWKKYKLRFSKTGVYLGRTAI
jgi:hypothetical protein